MRQRRRHVPQPNLARGREETTVQRRKSVILRRISNVNIDGPQEPSLRVAFFSTHPFDRQSFDEANARYRHDLHYFDARLSQATSALARGFPAVCAFVNDQLDVTVLMALSEGGTRMIALRSAGFNHVDGRRRSWV